MSFVWDAFAGRGMMGLPSRFEEQYHCYSMAYADKTHLEGGDKILLPPSAFDTLARLQVDYPMLFRLTATQKGTMTHCGVLEFTAEEGACFLPFWMMQNLLLEEGSLITVTNVSLPKATFVKLKPQHIDFLEISNPRAVLEHALRNFSCVTKGDVICVPYNSKNYHFELMDVQPNNAACIIETDCNVDFDAPVGYKEPEPIRSRSNSTSLTSSNNDNNSMKNDKVSSLSKPTSFSSSSANGLKNSTPGAASSISSSTATNIPSNTSMTTPSDTTSTEKIRTRIVDGKIIRPMDSNPNNYSNSLEIGGGYVDESSTTMLAAKTGVTGVQRNAAIACKAPQIEYWAIKAGEGARLDGKVPTPLRDKEGNEVDIRRLRAEAAARRMVEEASLKEAALKPPAMPSTGLSVDGKLVVASNSDNSLNRDTSLMNSNGDTLNADGANKRKSRVGSKYSKLKGSGGFAFHGSGQSFDA